MTTRTRLRLRASADAALRSGGGGDRDGDGEATGRWDGRLVYERDGPFSARIALVRGEFRGDGRPDM